MVLDASAVVEILLRTIVGDTLRARLITNRPALHAPHLLDIDVAHVLRRAARAGQIGAARGSAALADLAAFRVLRHPHVALLPRVWQLRNNLTAFDAIYIALAEALAAPLLTCDARLAAAPGHSARIELV